jgi:hypothetical protein
MKIYVLITGFVFTNLVGMSQNDPRMTEVWEPVPAKVMPLESFSMPPEDAIVLFADGDLGHWRSKKGGKANWTVGSGFFTVKGGTGDIKTRQEFGDVQLHIEWMVPENVKGEGQLRGNSGVFLQERYEVQILDSYENKTYANGQAGSIYKQFIPLVNACRKPGEWQSYDIAYKAPRFDGKGKLTSPARMTVFHNGILIHNNVELKGETVYIGQPGYQPHGKASLMLQDHGDEVYFRNIWIRELE